MFAVETQTIKTPGHNRMGTTREGVSNQADKDRRTARQVDNNLIGRTTIKQLDNNLIGKGHRERTTIKQLDNNLIHNGHKDNKTTIKQLDNNLTTLAFNSRPTTNQTTREDKTKRPRRGRNPMLMDKSLLFICINIIK